MVRIVGVVVEARARLACGHRTFRCDDDDAKDLEAAGHQAYILQ